MLNRFWHGFHAYTFHPSQLSRIFSIIMYGNWSVLNANKIEMIDALLLSTLITLWCSEINLINFLKIARRGDEKKKIPSRMHKIALIRQSYFQKWKWASEWFQKRGPLSYKCWPHFFLLTCHGLVRRVSQAFGFACSLFRIEALNKDLKIEISHDPVLTKL